MTQIVSTKQINYNLLQCGAFGNTLRHWSTYAQLEGSSYRGLVAMRYKDPRGGGSILRGFEVPFHQVWSTLKDWESRGADPDLVVFAEAPDNSKRVFQGELQERPILTLYTRGDIKGSVGQLRPGRGASRMRMGLLSM